MTETLDNVIIQIFMQAGTNLMFEHERLFWPPRNMRLDPQPGFVWPKGGFHRTVTHWKYKPLPGSAYGNELMDSIKYKFQKNENAFCQWFSIIFFFADHGDRGAQETFAQFREDHNIQNAKLVVEWVFQSRVPIIEEIRRDVAYLPNMVTFWNEGKSAAHRLSASEIKGLFNNALTATVTPKSPKAFKSPKVTKSSTRRTMFNANGTLDEHKFFTILKNAVHDLGY